MHFFQLAAAWLFPCAVCATMATTTVTAVTEGASTVEHGNSSLQAAFRAGGVKVGADPGSSPSADSTTSSSSSSFLGSRCVSPNGARSPEKQGGVEAASKGDVMRRCLRRLAKKLQRTPRADDDRPVGRRERRRKIRSTTKPDGRGAGVVDGTAREREEAVASAIAYCKETHRRSGTSPPPPSPSLDGWLIDRPEEEIGSACAAERCKCPVLRRDVSLLAWLPEAPPRTSSAAAHCKCPPLRRADVTLLEWLPGAPPCTSNDDVPHHRSSASCDEFGGKSAAATAGKLASRRCVTGELGVDDIAIDGLDIDVLRITNYFDVKDKH